MKVTALIRRVYFYVSSHKMSDRFLEQRINFQFYVMLGFNVSEICTVLFEAYETEAVKN